MPKFKDECNLGVLFDEHGTQKQLLRDAEFGLFKEKESCFIYQHSSILDATTGMKLDGGFTSSEDLPDHAGLRASYYAYLSNHNRRNGKLPGVEFTMERAFFVAFARVSFLLIILLHIQISDIL
jgi:predicted metalloendopeptidase